jgi:hypothetical protein
MRREKKKNEQIERYGQRKGSCESAFMGGDVREILEVLWMLEDELMELKLSLIKNIGICDGNDFENEKSCDIGTGYQTRHCNH